jgi:hypothetical protein
MTASTIAAAPRRGAMPLSYAQESLWQEAQWCPGHVAFHLYTSLRIDGALDVALLEQCLSIIVARHEILRAVFVAGPAQAFVRDAEWPLPVVEIGDAPADGRTAALHRLAREEVARPFDLSAGPLFRGTLFRLSAREHVVLLVIHHLLGDGLSKNVLLQELAALYTALAQQRAPALPPLAIQYGDYAVWQRGRLQGPVLEALLAFWTRQVGGAPICRRRRGDRADLFVKRRHGFTLSAAFDAAASAVMRRERVTRFIVVLWALSTWICRQRRDPDVVVLSEMANRLRLETEPLIGLFADMMILRTKLDPGLPPRDTLRRVRAATLEAYSHQELPFMLVIEALRSVLAHGHLRCDAFLNVRPLRRFHVAVPGATWQHVTLVPEEVASPLDLNVTVKDDARGSQATVFFNPEIYDPAEVDMMDRDLERIVASAA